MKKLLIVGMMVITMTSVFSGCSKKNVYTSVVPNSVLNEFYDMYPTAEKVHWKMNGEIYEADFKISGQEMKATYTPNGNFVRKWDCEKVGV